MYFQERDYRRCAGNQVYGSAKLRNYFILPQTNREKWKFVLVRTSRTRPV